MAIFLIMLVLVLLFTSGLTLWLRHRKGRPVGALLMLLPMAICGNVVFSLATSYTTTETAAPFNPDPFGSQESRGEFEVETDIQGEVVTQVMIFVVGTQVLFTLGLLVWGTMFLAWLRRRGRPQTAQVQE